MILIKHKNLKSLFSAKYTITSYTRKILIGIIIAEYSYELH